MPCLWNKRLVAFEKDVMTWERVRHSSFLEKVEEVFKHLSEHMQKIWEEEELTIQASESKLTGIRAKVAQVQQAINIQRQTMTMAEGEIMVARQMIADANSILARADPVDEAYKAKLEELTN